MLRLLIDVLKFKLDILDLVKVCQLISFPETFVGQTLGVVEEAGAQDLEGKVT
jgi:hypothetical protein